MRDFFPSEIVIGSMSCVFFFKSCL